ncbi:MAG: acetyl-CoA carboxylase carboxyltransferase subunit alpha [Armatimonadetes bacterium]|nr:acetyl-CoA carboxylase carboxyltransferase subunit alpha [Armatimonadota bacterium]
MSLNILDFETDILDLEAKIAELEAAAQAEGVDMSAAIAQAERRRDRLVQKVYRNLSPWQKTMLARHPQRPYTLDYIRLIFDEFTELQGDRLFADDRAIVGGLARLDGQPVVVVGHQKGRDLKERQHRNFGYARPEGYRKALRLMKLAAKFHIPVISFVDTPGADASVPSEERGISEAIARNMMEISVLPTPIVVAVIGEGGSGGAIGIGVGDVILMQEYAIYSVIAPEGCAAILWRAPERAPEAAEAMKITAEHALGFGLIDKIVPEPLRGAHRNHEESASSLKESLLCALKETRALSLPELLDRRYRKFRAMGRFEEAG